MTFRPDIHHRRNLRLLEYDYSAEGLYFITICTHERKPLFGKIKEDEMLLNGTGQIIEQQYHLLEQRFPHIQCLEHVVMPNHFHCIIRITDNYVGAPLAGALNTSDKSFGHPQGVPLQRATIGEIVGAFKSITTNECLRIHKARGKIMGKLWQRNFYEHIIRSQRSYEEISTYILENPKRWIDDSLYIISSL